MHINAISLIFVEKGQLGLFLCVYMSPVLVWADYYRIRTGTLKMCRLAGNKNNMMNQKVEDRDIKSNA